MFKLQYDVLLYDLTSTYFEGLCKRNPKARFGHSKDRRGDCRQVLVALVVTPEGLRASDQPRTRTARHQEYPC